MELFELYLSPINGTRFKAIVTQSPVGEGESESELPFIEGRKDWRISLIKALESTSFCSENFPEEGEQEWLVKAGILASDRNTFHPDYQANIGRALYRVLFPSNSKVEKALQKSISLAEDKHTQLLIRLKFEADVVQRSRLADYPWELLHNGQKFLCHHQVGLARYIAHDTAPPSLPRVEQVNVLLVSSAACDSDLGLKPLSKQEQQAIRDGLEKASVAGHIRLSELSYPTLKELRAYLTEYQGDKAPQVLHFDGHGLFGKRCSNQKCRTMHKGIKRERCRACKALLPEPQGYLVFEDEYGRADYISGSELGTLLQQSSLNDSISQSRGISLCVLSACQSGMAVAGESAFNGAAQNLVGHRVPAVVAMQYSVSVESASNFAEQFYRSLGQKNSLAVAVSQGREAMGVENNQWYRPVLYLRWPEGGQLFATPPTSAGILPASIPSNLPRSGVIKFVGRGKVLETLHQQLQQTERVGICAIAGMGGIGKTELALQYAMLHKELGTYPGGICWSEEAAVGLDIVSFAKVQLNMQLPSGLDLEEQVAYCWRNWQEGEVLLILDDVRDYLQVKSYLPPPEPRFKVLFTSRRQWLGESFETLSLDVLSEEAATELLTSLVGKERIDLELDQAKQLCLELGFLPLGLELVGRYLKRKPHLSIAQMRQRLGLEHRSLQKPSGEMTEQRGVAAAFELSWQELDPLAQQLGCLLSLFALAPFAWQLVNQCLPDSDEEDLEDIRDYALTEYSLLQQTGEETYSLHQLIREFFQNKLKQFENGEKAKQVNEMKQNLCFVMVAVANTIPQYPTQEFLLEVEDIIPHVEEVAIALRDYLSEADFITPFQGLGRFYEGKGLYSQAEIWYKRCRDQVEERFGAEHFYLARTSNNLASIYQAQGQYSKAEPLYKQALEIRRKLLEQEHPDTAESLNNLALLYNYQGRYEEAELLYKQALDMRRKLFGEEHPDLAESLSNLAWLYQDQGRYEEAESLFLQTLEMRQRLLDANHLRIADSFNALGSCYYHQKRYQESEKMYLQALNLYKELFGDKHRDVAMASNSLALVYSEQGKYEAAEPLLTKALEIQKHILGEKHPDVATGLTNLAALYEDLGNTTKAESLYHQVLDMRKQLLGEMHPDVAISLNNLAKFNYNQKRYEVAKPLYSDAVRILETKLGSNHPNTVKVKNNLEDLKSVMDSRVD
ncbi:tetratricopeptide repeat protein [Moorena sp. SIO3I8]|uniref:tetratricopeptide repeat protein n=1 Tax=Moorena sp. SIO3I8 TaxID=2607833 RepID=UPI0025F5E94B|nr:tetratricopeptide repeat protein [Moorena sp. SIO3I8]